MQRPILIAVLTVAVGCGTRSALTPDGSAAAVGANRDGANDAALDSGNGLPPSDGPSDAADADPCSPYRGGLGIIRESRLPAGACNSVASCSINTRDDTCGSQKQWRCACQTGTWACILIVQDKLDCQPPDAGGGDGGLTSPDAAFCCPRDTMLSGCMHLGGVDQLGCYSICDFWCSTNWRVETDKYGCERWAMDYRMPAPGESMECLPERDADAAVGSEAGSEAGSDSAGRVPYQAIAVVTGEIHTCALLTDHHVKCWGIGEYGALGYGDLRSRGSVPAEMGDALPIVDLGTGRTATAIAAGRYATCAILDDGSLKCWGAALNGQPSKGVIGDEPGEMGDDLAPLYLGGRNVLHVGMSQYVACASTDDQTIWCWGAGASPKPVYGGGATNPVRALSADGGDVMVLFDDGSVLQQLGTSPSPLDFGGKVVAIGSAISRPPCAVLEGGMPVCGSTGMSQGTGLPNGAVAIGAQQFGSLCAVYGNGSLICVGGASCGSPGAANDYWCNDDDNAIALGEPASSVTSGGSAFGCALLASGGVKCWGGVQGPGPWLGSSVAVSDIANDGGVTYGAWNKVDLGTHD